MFGATENHPDFPINAQRGGAIMILSYITRLLRMWQRYDQTVRELSRLNDRELADLGLVRSDIVARAWKAAEAV